MNILFNPLKLFSFDPVKFFYKILLSIDLVIYNIIGGLFKVFMYLADTRIMSSDIIHGLTTRLYSILSVVMLFVLAYTLIRVIVNPDNAFKGTTSAKQMVINVVVALFVIIFTPSIFEFAYGIQNSIIENNVVGKVIIGGSNSYSITQAGGEFTTSVFQSSYYLASDASDAAQIDYEYAELASKYNEDIYAFSDTVDYVASGDIKYHFFVSLIVGIFVGYLLVVFAFDLGIRAVKLAFLEIIAPIPALFSIIPGKADSLKKWAKETLACYAEVLIRLVVMFFMVYMFSVVNQALDDGSLFGFTSVEQPLIAAILKLFIIFGLLVFAKQAPKMILDILGFKSEGGFFSLKKRTDELKKASKPITNTAGRVVGGVGGAVASSISNQRGRKARLDKLLEQGKIDNKEYQKRMYNVKDHAKDIFLGAYYGSRKGGLKGIGTAYNAGFDTQLYKANGATSKQVLLNLLRDNVGMQSVYEEKIKTGRIETDAIASIATKINAHYTEAIEQKRAEINKKYDSKTKENTEARDALKKVKSHCEDKVSKEDSAYTSQVLTFDVNTGKYELTKMNTNQIKKYRENLMQSLSEAGYSVSESTDIYRKVCNTKATSADLTSALAAGPGSDLYDVAYDLSLKYGTSGLAGGITTYKDSLSKIVKDYYDHELTNMDNHDFQYLLDQARGSVKASNVGITIDASGRDDDTIRTTQIPHGFDNGDNFSKLLKSLNDTVSDLSSGKINEENGTIVRVFEFDDEGKPKAGSYLYRSIKDINNEMKQNSEIVKELNEAQKLVADSMQGIKAAEDASKKHRAMARPKGGDHH